MSANIYYENIQKYLFQYADQLEHSNSLGLTNQAVHAENLFITLFNLVFGWKLVNANSKVKNQRAFDLVDYQAKVCVQVTSNKQFRSKFNKTVTSFSALDDEVELVIVFFIKKKIPRSLGDTLVGNIRFEAYDICRLLKEIFYRCGEPEKLAQIDKILAMTVSPVRLHDENVPLSPATDLPFQFYQGERSGIYISRETLVGDLFTFCQHGNGLLVGGPGYGKSFIIEELYQYCAKEGVPCLVVRINDLIDGSSDEIGEELRMTNWFEVLSATVHPIYKSVLVFDAFDTAKDEKLKTNILKHIKRVKQEMPNWKILVSVRTYDATKSVRLLELFPSGDVRRNIPCRHFVIPELSDEELNGIFARPPFVDVMIGKVSPNMFHLMKTPYFLKMFESLLMDGTTDCTYNSVETEEELLEMFWKARVMDSTLKDIFLSKLTSVLAGNGRLVCNKSEILTDINAPTFDELVSLGLIEEASTNRQKVSFTHNILLDYAIARYLLAEDYEHQHRYIEANEKMPFIFRQSFIYFYTSLYKHRRKLFWEHYFKTDEKDTALFRLFHQTTFVYIVINNYSVISDLDPIFYEVDYDRRGRMLRKVLECVRFVSKGGLREKDIDLLLRVSKESHWMPLWDNGILIQYGISLFSDNADDSHIEKLSDASCNTLEYVLEGRKDVKIAAVLDANGGGRAVENICKMLPHNLERATGLFRLILEILSEDSFPIRYFHELAEHICTIYSYDSAFAIEAYMKMYMHIESSDKETNLGSAVMGLRSNRKQDYGIVSYNLEKSFSKLLGIDFLPAMRLGIDIINRTNRYWQTEPREETMLKIGTLNASIYSDYSFSDSDKENGPASHVTKIFTELDKILMDGTRKDEGMEKLYVLIPEIKAALVWRRLVKLLVKYPFETNGLALEILCNADLYTFYETVYELGELLKVCWIYVPENGKVRIEEIVLGLPLHEKYKGLAEAGEKLVSRLLNCIPTDELVTGPAKDFVARINAEENVPIITSDNAIAAEARYMEREEKARYKGFDLADAEDGRFYSLIEQLEAFNDKWGEKKEELGKVDYDPVIGHIELLFPLVEKWPERQKRGTEYEIARTAQILSRKGLRLSKSNIELIKRITLNCLNDPMYHAKDYEGGDLDVEHNTFGPSARSFSVPTLINLIYEFGQSELKPLLLSLMSDNVQIIRFKALHGLVGFWKDDRSTYWETVFKRAQLENDSVCLKRLIEKVMLSDIMKADLSKVEAFLTIVMHKLRSFNKELSRELWHYVVVMALKLILYHQSKAASALITDNLDVNGFCREVVFEIVTVIDPHDLRNDYAAEPARYSQLIGILKEMMEYRFKCIELKGLNSSDIKVDFEIIDNLVQQLYFTVSNGRSGNKGNFVEEASERAFYAAIKPIIDYVAERSAMIGSGFMAAHTGYYFIQLLNRLLDLDPAHILYLSNSIVLSASKGGFTYDSSTLKEIVKLTERLMADHREILYEAQNFKNLIIVLDQFANSGWQEALEMTWRLRDVF